MNTLNCVTLIGYMGHDPKMVEEGGRHAQLSLATHTVWKDKNGEFKTITEWHAIKIYNEWFIESVVPKLKKGDLIFVEWALKTRKWKDNSGNTHHFSTIVVGKHGGKIMLLKSSLKVEEEDVEEIPLIE